MKQKNFLKIALTLLFLIVVKNSFGQTELYNQGFETDLTGYSQTPNQTPSTDPGDQYFSRAEPSNTDIYEGSVGPYTNVTGSWLFVGSNPNTINSGNPGTLATGLINVTGYENFELSIDFGAVPNDWDASDELKVEYSWNNTDWFTLYNFVAQGSTNQPLDLANNSTGGNNTANGVTLTYALQTITSTNFTGSGNSLYIRIVCNSGANYEAFALDNIILTGTLATSDPIIGFDSAISSETETNSSFNVLIPVTVSNYDGNQIDISIASSGTAEPADFTLNTSSLSFTANGSQNVSLDINPDTDDFEDETIILTLTETSSVTGLIISQNTHTVTVTEDETPPSIGFDTTTSSETETDATFTSANIPITVSDYSGTQIDIDVAITGGTAEAGDYTYTTQSLSFTTNETQNITIDINDDADTDAETIIFTITETSSVTGLIISEATHTLTILDDEIPPIPTAGVVFITEILDSDNGFNNDYLELYNNSNENISLYNSKLLRFSSSDVYEYSYDFGIDESTSSVDITIPAYGFLIIARGSTRSDFNTANGITLDAGVNFNGGNSDLFFGTGRRWKLVTGGTPDTNDGTLIADTNAGVGTNKDYLNIFTNTYISGSTNEGTPGELEYLVYNGGAWVNSVAMDATTGAKDAYIYDDLVLSANSAANNIGIVDNKGIDIDAGISLIINGDLTLNGTNSYLQANATMPSAGVINSATVLLSGNYTSGGTNQFFYFTETYHNNDEGWSLISSPTVGEVIDGGATGFATFNALKTSDSKYGIAPYNNTVISTNRWDYYSTTEIAATNNVVMLSGKGYSVFPNSTLNADTANGNLGFKGAVPTTDVSIAITNNSGGVGNAFNLIGSPYPSFIPFNTTANALNILSTNTAILEEETIWFWDKATTSYITVNQTTTVGTGANQRPSLYISPAQGFFVKATTGGGSFSFTEAMQSHQTSGFFNKTQSLRPEINLTVNQGKESKKTQILYFENKTTGFDNGYDSSIFNGFTSNFNVYTNLVANNNTNKKLAIQSLPNTDYENMVIPVGIISEANSEITFSAEVVNLPNGLKVQLEDRATGQFTNLNEANYTVVLNEKQDGSGRFFIHTSQKTLSVNSDILSTASIYKVNNQTLKINGLKTGNASIAIYNILGKQVLNKNLQTTNSFEVALPNMASGVYVVKLNTKEGQLSTKIMID